MKVLNQLDSLDNIKDGETRKLITKTTSSGNGNAVTSVSVSGDTITYTKDATYGTSNLALGETSSTAYRGDRGKTAYNHASDGNKLTTATDSGLYKIASTAEGHIKSLTAVEKSDITALGIPGSDTNTTYTLSADTTNNKITLTPSTGTANSITVPYATSAGKATNDKNGDDIATTYYKASNPSGYTSNTGTITGVSVNGTSVATSGVANITSIPANIIAPIATKTYTDIIGDSGANSEAGDAFYFGSIRPSSYTDSWEVRYRVRAWVPNNTNYEAIAEVLFTGVQGSINSYAVFNHILNTSYKPCGYHCVHRLKQAGYTAGYGHAIGVNLQDANNRDSTSLKRSVSVEVLSQKNCIVTLNDTAVKWANWTGTGSTNYNDIGNYNFSSNGLQETGDNNDIGVLRSYYDRPIVGDATNLFPQNLCTYTSDDKVQPFVSSYSTGTSKTKNTSTFRLGAPIFFYASWTELAKGASKYPGDSTMSLANKGISLQYSTNCGTTLTLNKPVYLVGIPNGATFTLADTWWTQTLPSTEDGKIYIHLGYTFSNYQISWQPFHPIYWYKNGGIKLYETPITSSDVTTALGYTPYSSANPNGYTSNTGTITKVQVNSTDVASSGTANITSVPASILTGAIPSAVTATTQSQGNNSTKIATTAYVDTAISNLPEPMKFKGTLGTGGTVTSLPTTGVKVGDTYKVITAGTYASQAAKVGDMFIASATTPTWEYVPSGDDGDGTVTSITIKATSPIAIDSSSAITTSGERTISHANSGVTAGTYKSVTVNATGHVTAGSNPTTLSGYGITDAKIASGVITLGSNTITPLTSSSTLDATKLSGTIPSGCYTNTTYTAGTGLTLDGTQFKHTNSVTAATAGTSSATSGSTLAVPYVTYDAQGHVTAAGTHTHTVTGFATTDTKNTAGSTDTSSKIYLIGATSQAANPQTYSDNEVYATSGVLTTKSVQVGGTAATMQYNSTDKCIEFVFA